MQQAHSSKTLRGVFGTCPHRFHQPSCPAEFVLHRACTVPESFACTSSHMSLHVMTTPGFDYAFTALHVSVCMCLFRGVSHCRPMGLVHLWVWHVCYSSMPRLGSHTHPTGMQEFRSQELTHTQVYAATTGVVGHMGYQPFAVNTVCTLLAQGSCQAHWALAAGR